MLNMTEAPLNIQVAPLHEAPSQPIQTPVKLSNNEELKSRFSSQVNRICTQLGSKTKKEQLQKSYKEILEQHKEIETLFHALEERIKNRRASCCGLSEYGSCIMYTFLTLGGITQIGELAYSTFAPTQGVHIAFPITKYIVFGLGVFSIIADKIANGAMSNQGAEDPEKDFLQCQILKVQSEVFLNLLKNMQDCSNEKNIQVQQEYAEINIKMNHCFEQYQLLSNDLQQQVQLSKLISFCLSHLPLQHPLRQELEKFKTFVKKHRKVLEKVKKLEKKNSLTSISWNSEELTSLREENYKIKTSYQQYFKKLQSDIQHYFDMEQPFPLANSFSYIDLDDTRFDENGVEGIPPPQELEVIIDIPQETERK
jgi:hypothetical protein